MATANVPRVPENVLKQGYLKKCVQTNDIIPSASKQIAKNIKQIQDVTCVDLFISDQDVTCVDLFISDQDVTCVDPDQTSRMCQLFWIYTGCTGIKKLEPNRWYVFGVRNRRPYLEFFEKEESIFTGPPLQSYDLSTFQNLSYTMGRTNTNYSFCIFLAESTIELTAPSRAHMVDWCRCLERNLRNLGLRSKNQKDDHQYTEFPVKSNYTPRHTGLDDEEMSLEDKMVHDTELKSELDDEDHDHDYQDASALVLEDDKTSIDGEPTLPLRPPPRKPRKQNEQEEVFVSLSTCRREDMYSNFQDHDHDVNLNEEQLFGSGTDSADEDHDDRKQMIDGSTKPNVLGHQDGKEDELIKFDDEDDINEDSNDRCTSLPTTLHNLPLESDTSEDSDFVPTSFWLRNRMENGEDGGPPVPRRLDSNKPSVISRNCKSMYVDYLKPRCVSPTLAVLGEAPALPTRDTNITVINVSNIPKTEPKTDDQIVLLDNDSDWYAVPRNKKIPPLRKSSSGPGICDKKLPSNGENDLGEYEFLAEKPRSPGSPVKIPDSGMSVNGEIIDDTYEATWNCSSARRRSLIDDDDDCCSKLKSEGAHVNESSAHAQSKTTVDFDDDYDDCCAKRNSESFVVDLPEASCEKNGKKHNTAAKEQAPMRPHSSESQSTKSKGGVLSKIFNRKSKDRELPESLVVSLPPQNSEGGCGSEGQEEAGNLYSDFPSPVQKKTFVHLDSDILKMSLENGPVSDPSSPIELPKRDFVQHPLKKPTNENTKLKQNMSSSLYNPIQGFSQDAYEPIDMSRSAHTPGSLTNGVQNKGSKFNEFPSEEDVPVAPPRRNRKSDKSKPDGTSSPEMERKVTGSPPIPKKRQSVLKALSVSAREPALPPRHVPSPTDNEKPSLPPLPPPPRPKPISRAASDLSGGARPRSMHLTSRQQSINQSNNVNVVNLKQNQVDILRSEISSSGGLVKIISKVHFQNGLALVECYDKIWIAGWDVKKYPRLYDKFHIGDQLQAINDVQVSDVSFANKLVKNVKAENIEITIRRLPHARVFAIQRSAEGESLGIKRDGGTAEVVYIDPLGLVYRNGLMSKAPTIDGSGTCNWTLTEINMRPLNLFFKDNEIEHRLLAVGKDISIVVQPSDFIKELKKQLKKLKGYKDFLVQ